MSWIEDELRRREALEALDGAAGAPKSAAKVVQAKTTGILSLWDRFEAANKALPEKLQLRRQPRKPGPVLPGAPNFLVWLIATNGAGLGLTEDGIRYLWPEENRLKSNNFWIHFDPSKGYQLVRRVGATSMEPSTSQRRFKEAAVDEILRCLVTNTRVDYKAVSGGWLSRFFK